MKHRPGYGIYFCNSRKRWIVKDRNRRDARWSWVIVQHHLHRELKPGETVHHRNKNSADDEPRNLVVFPSESLHRWWHTAVLGDAKQYYRGNGSEDVWQR